MIRLALGTLALVALVGCGRPTINVVDPFAAVNWSPHDGAICVDPDWPNLSVGACLNRTIDASSLNQVSLRKAAADGSPTDTIIDATVDVSAADPACIEVKQITLEGATDYVIVLDPGLTASDGTRLDKRLTSVFRTLDNGC